MALDDDDDGAFVLNLADDGDAGVRARKGNPRRRTVARASKKGWRGGGDDGATRAREGRTREKRARDEGEWNRGRARTKRETTRDLSLIHI